MLDDIITKLNNNSGHHAYCFIGSNEAFVEAVKKIADNLHIPEYEQWLSTDEVTSIANIRSLIDWLSKKPTLSTKKLVYIPLEKIKWEAMTALLKTIEEPPTYALIFVSSRSAQSILPTIKSRCQMVYLNEEILTGKPAVAVGLETFINSQKILEEQTAGEIIDSWLIELREKIRQGYETNIAHRLLEIKKYTNTNSNSRLLLELALVELSKEQS